MLSSLAAVANSSEGEVEVAAAEAHPVARPTCVWPLHPTHNLLNYVGIPDDRVALDYFRACVNILRSQRLRRDPLVQEVKSSSLLLSHKLQAVNVKEQCRIEQRLRLLGFVGETLVAGDAKSKVEVFALGTVPVAIYSTLQSAWVPWFRHVM